MKGHLKEVLRGHEAFWRREEMDRPLMLVTHYSLSRDGVPPMRLRLPDGSYLPDGVMLTPEMLDPQAIHADFGPDSEGSAFGRTPGASPEATGGPPAMAGDVFLPAAPYPVVPWMEAILQCPIQVSLTSHSMWAEPLGRPWSARTARLHLDRRWLNRLAEFTHYLVASSGGRYLVATTLMRGVSDMLNATMGDEAFCLALHDSPDTVHRLADSAVEIFLEAARTQTDYIGRFHGGTCTPFGIWAPGSSIRTQDDAAVLISPRHYARFILPRQERIASAFDYSVIHLHSANLHIVDLICDSSITAVQVTIDPQPFGPPVRDLIGTFLRILKKKPLMIDGPFTRAELEHALGTLPAKGLFISARMQTEEDRAKTWGEDGRNDPH